MSVRCGKTGRGIPYPSLPGYEVIPAWSRGKQPWNKLSPMKIGPINLQEPQLFYYPSTETVTVGPVTSTISTCKLFENWLQGEKYILNI